jgi:hypothetical protein
VDDYERFLQRLTVERFGGAARAQADAGLCAGQESCCQGQSLTEGAGPPGAPRRRAEPGLDKLLLRVDEAAEMLGVGRTRVYALIGSGNCGR